MSDAKQRRRDLRALIAEGELVVAPGAHDGLTARLIEDAGFPAVYMTGSGVANTLLGQPDVGLLSMTEMVTTGRYVASATRLPVIADADTGYGNAVNVMRTVREYEAAGVAGIHIEDQVSPKRCGHILGKELIPAEEMAGKIRAACDARTDSGLMIIARTDARGPAGLDEAIRRACLYAEAGADVSFPDALLSEDEFRTFAQSVPGPKMMNMGGYAKTRTTPKLPLETVREIGFSIVIFPLAVVRAGVRAIIDFLGGLKAHGTAFEEEYIAGLEGHPTESWYAFTGIESIREIEARYLPDDAVTRKYTSGKGYAPGEGVRR
jgi:2-methylisocitrate lyase-like PEP mutase family enzyme